MPAKKTTTKATKTKATKKKTTKKAAPKKAKKTTKTEAKPKQGRKIKTGQAYECGVCGFRVVVDACGNVDEHYLICCRETMKQKRPSRGKK